MAASPTGSKRYPLHRPATNDHREIRATDGDVGPRPSVRVAARTQPRKNDPSCCISLVPSISATPVSQSI
jgi:hypothetical protein